MPVGLKRVGIIGTGAFLPDNKVTNFDLEKIVETSNEWIITRTGISERRILDESMSTSSMAVRASEKALLKAGIRASDLDLIIVATVTPDMIFPATACLLQKELGAVKAAAFDLSAGCSGFIYGLSVASEMISTGRYKNALVIGADALSRITDWQDRSTCVLFGDAAGACVLAQVEGERGILSTYIGADGRGADLLKMPAGGSRHPSSHETVDQRLHYIQMNGSEVYKFAVRIVVDSVFAALKKCDLKFKDIDLLIPHQANIRIIEAAQQRMGIPPEKVMVNIDRYGNTSNATIPVALYEAVNQGRLQTGDIVVVVGFGAGLTWGSVVLRW